MSKYTKQPLSQLKEIKDLRDVWGHEAHNFTQWLFQKDNLELLSEAIGVDIEGEATEVGVGSFRVDIVGTESETGKSVIIENQLEDTDHDHLGKIITYAAGKDAEIIVWVVKHAREEHRAAIEWLNNHTDSKISFFLCEIKLYQIGNSPIAVKFDVIEKPNGWIKQQPEQLTETQKVRYEYWSAFLNFAEKDSAFCSEFKLPNPSYDHWLTLRIGTSICHVDVLNIQKSNEICVSIYIGNDKEYFDVLEQDKQAIEEEMGGELQWINNKDKIASSVRLSKKANIKKVQERDSQFRWIIDNAIKLKRIAKEHISK
jgi:hypothetical protein